MKKLLFIFICALSIWFGFIIAHADEITKACDITYTAISPGTQISIVSTEPISSLYIRFNKIYGEWELSCGGEIYTYGLNNFLHEYVDIAALTDENTTSLILTFERRVSIGEIFVFSSGELPAWVQRWETPNGLADMLLLPTHSDDEHLYFAGSLAYAIEKGYSVQVVYFTNHFDTNDRPHEQLDGLWASGVTRYPIISPFPDKYAESLAEAETIYKSRGYNRDGFIAFHVEMIRRFKPQVVVGHDINGEYGHGVHMYNTNTLIEALEYTADETRYPESADLYGAYDVPKAYIHLYKENQIILNIDEPLGLYDGLTAFQVSQGAFMYHKSQHWPGFYSWLYGRDSSAPITKSSQIKTYNPSEFGLYKSTVGPDILKNDFFENIVSYEEQAAKQELRRAKANPLYMLNFMPD